MASFFKNIDIYGVEYKLSVKQSESAQTIFGGVLTTITYIATIISIWFLGQDVIFKENPNFVKDSLISEKALPLTLDKFNYPLAFFIADVNFAMFNNDSIVSLHATKVKYHSSDVGTFIPELSNYDLAICNRTSFPNLKDIDQYYFTNSLCIKNQNITLAGLYADSQGEYFTITADLCDWKKENNTCASKEEILSTVSGLSFNFIAFDSSINFSSFDSPINPYINSYFSQFLANFTKFTYFTIQKQELETDSGFLWPIFNSITFLQSEISSFDIFDRGTSKTVMNFSFYATNKNTIFKRSYVKIADILGNVGGILQVITVCFTFINQPFTNVEKYVGIANTLIKINKKLNSKILKLIFKKIINN